MFCTPQLWLLLPAARGRRVRYSGWVIAAFALINGAVPIVGARWFAGAEQLAVLLTVFVWPRWAVPAVAAPAAAPAAMAAAGRNVTLRRYFAQNTVFWSLLIATLIWPARVAAKLRASRQELANSAVMAERLRIDDELAASVGRELERLLAAGQRAARLAGDYPAAAERELRSLTTYSRRAKTRRMVSQYQAVTVRSEMATAMTLLAAAGSSAIQDVDSTVLDHAFDSDHTAGVRRLSRARL
jgi:two-component system sensor histidine kinase DesK